MAGNLPDILADNLSVVFCGLNPGLDAAASGHHFIGRGNRFWRVLHLAGFTSTQIDPKDDRSLLGFGYGLTTVVARPTASATEVSKEAFREGGIVLRGKIEYFAPRHIAFLGKAAFAAITDEPKIAWGRQPTVIGGATVWILPNPSGRNLSFSLDALTDAYGALQRELHS